ncbi:ORF MSV230 hypothetical protein [Melanoplus sanguinipes entomopoxvirus]|uniref:Uncharacterized protein n=1 Tax=Melanoplus sanguinipes entomopoxvirus TaxID=83191 RepID=Q9YVL2_MSEPV|nr:ORF MSV230 hypothetical protein [Melanoplus sanguinipes entomopoxvirus]AAC97713.1 ORF MSV230 hypothetical protein [Melanoplus sanguinipes entomopoxvirus 'O']
MAINNNFHILLDKVINMKIEKFIKLLKYKYDNVNFEEKKQIISTLLKFNNFDKTEMCGVSVEKFVQLINNKSASEKYSDVDSSIDESQNSDSDSDSDSGVNIDESQNSDSKVNINKLENESQNSDSKVNIDESQNSDSKVNINKLENESQNSDSKVNIDESQNSDSKVNIDESQNSDSKVNIDESQNSDSKVNIDESQNSDSKVNINKPENSELENESQNSDSKVNIDESQNSDSKVNIDESQNSDSKVNIDESQNSDSKVNIDESQNSEPEKESQNSDSGVNRESQKNSNTFYCSSCNNGICKIFTKNLDEIKPKFSFYLQIYYLRQLIENKQIKNFNIMEFIKYYESLNEDKIKQQNLCEEIEQYILFLKEDKDQSKHENDDDENESMNENESKHENDGDENESMNEDESKHENDDDDEDESKHENDDDDENESKHENDDENESMNEDESENKNEMKKHQSVDKDKIDISLLNNLIVDISSKDNNDEEMEKILGELLLFRESIENESVNKNDEEIESMNENENLSVIAENKSVCKDESLSVIVENESLNKNDEENESKHESVNELQSLCVIENKQKNDIIYDTEYFKKYGKLSNKYHNVCIVNKDIYCLTCNQSIGRTYIKKNSHNFDKPIKLYVNENIYTLLFNQPEKIVHIKKYIKYNEEEIYVYD